MMTFDHNQIDSLMQWARLQAPLDRDSLRTAQPVPRRRVRIEIGAEQQFKRTAVDNSITTVIMRVYLAEPRCQPHNKVLLQEFACECGPIAETRIG